MIDFDLDALLAPVSAQSPTGEDLEYDPDFLTMMQAAEGKPERRMGEVMIPAEDPDWARVRALAVSLLGRSKDLRIAVLLTRALLKTEGVTGLQVGLALITGFVTDYWDDLHPRLDPDEGLDPSIRINVLLDLCGRDTLLLPLRVAPLIRSRVFGVVTYRDIEIAEGRVAAPKDVVPLDSATMAGAFQECALDELREVALAAQAASRESRALGEALSARVAVADLPSFEPLTELLSALQRELMARLGQREPVVDPGFADDPAVGQASAESPPPVVSPSGQINSREDVIRTLDRLCDYYTLNEPSSPVPLLLKRARRLVTGDFVEILRDLAPDALPQINQICGLDG
ncbi:MAG: type VI secretion system protein TssA [Sphingobacteriia bacterium]|nr:type VI secretion system protein TssA [Sphingobacteriia bacterium]NCC39423.1 type VI secretion system protein TssA [Gammaproteobacteria bacterium]